MVAPAQHLVYGSAAQARKVAAIYLAPERRKEPVYFDTETTGLDPHADKLVLLQFKQGTRKAVLFDVRDAPEVVLAMGPVLSSRRIVGHNVGFDIKMLLAAGIEVKLPFDTQIAEQLIQGVGMERARKDGKPMGLKDVAKRRLGVDMSKGEREWFYKPAPLHTRPEWDQPIPPEQLRYSEQDVDVLPEIHRQQRAELEAAGLLEVFAIEMRALVAIAAMELAGIRIDVDGWRAFIAEKAAEAKRLEDEVLRWLGPSIVDERIRLYDWYFAKYEKAKADEGEWLAAVRREFDDKPAVSAWGDEKRPWGEVKRGHMASRRETHPIPARPKLDTDAPNIGSPKQLAVAFKALGIPVPTKKNDKGEVVDTTDSDALEKLLPAHPEVAPLVGWRKAAKFVDSFGESLLAHAGPDGRIHPSYTSIGASTGRMSCSQPNWQQIPSKGDGKRLRALVIAAPGCKLLTADFSNIEARVAAEFSGDAVLLGIFARGEDLHSITAKMMFKLEDAVDPKKTPWKHGMSYRDIAKTINYGLFFGMSPFKLAADTGIPLAEAEGLFESYFAAYPTVGAYLAGQRKTVHQTMKSVTASGRLRFYHSPGPQPSQHGYRDYADFKEATRQWKKLWGSIERQAMNTPIQGTSADITKLAVALFYERCDPTHGRLVACVHDELVVEAKAARADAVAAVLAAAMKDAATTYLHVVTIPDTEVSIDDHWTKD